MEMRRRACSGLVGKLEGKRSLGRHKRRWEDNIKMHVDWSGTVYGQVAGSCECCNEPSGTINCGEFLDWLRSCQLLKKDPTPWS